jgi:hypothetical protein
MEVMVVVKQRLRASPGAEVRDEDGRQHQPARRRPTMWTAVTTTQQMKLTLCTSTSVPRLDGPIRSRATPVANTIAVSPTSAGPSARSAGGGGLLRR